MLKVRRIICDKGYPTDTEIDIKSEILKNALSDIFEGVEGLKLNEFPPVASPNLLFYARAGLEDRIAKERSRTNPNKALIEELLLACQYVSEDFGSRIETLASLMAHEEITFDLLWTLFPPRTTIYTKDNLLREEQLLTLQTSDYASRENGSRYLSLNLRMLSHDGEKFGWVDKAMEIDQFEGARKISQLKCIPLQLGLKHRRRRCFNPSCIRKPSLLVW